MVPGLDNSNLELTLDIKQKALALGFARVGVARAQGLHPEAEHLRDWLANGFHGEMHYLKRTEEVRSNPTHQGMLPEAMSVVVVAAPYERTKPHLTLRPGRIARYAQGRDYHRVLHKHLEKLARGLRAQGFATRCAVDRLPVLERAWAQRAGVGFVGKNCCLIVPGIGSHVFLAALVTAAPLHADAPMKERCGTCRRCLDRCPTQAFVGPRQMDARQCISYLTIEHRGSIEERLRPGMGQWAFGCDECQDVCPYNQGKSPQDAVMNELAPLERLTELTAIDVLTRKPEELSQALEGSPLRRPGAEGLARNVAIVLGNTADKVHLPVLKQAALAHPSALVREAAAWAEQQIVRANSNTSP